MNVEGLKKMKGVNLPKVSQIGIVVPYEEAMERIGEWVKEKFTRNNRERHSNRRILRSGRLR